jgi:hypothetical protein
MPNSQQHQTKANHNRAFLNSLNIAQFPDWGAVGAFYTAVHLVERLRTLLPNPANQHSVDHQDRLQFVQRYHRPVHAAYRDLYNASLIARYQTVNSFTTQFSAADVQNILIDQCLVAIEHHVVNQFAPPSPSPPTTGS